MTALQRLSAALLWAALALPAGAEMFEGTLFTPPPTPWQRAADGQGAVSFTLVNAQRTQAMVMGLYASRPARTDVMAEFEAEWQASVPPLGQVTALHPVQQQKGMLVRDAVVQVAGDGKRYVMLAMFQGAGRVVSAVLQVNPPEAAAQASGDFSRFLSSIQLSAPVEPTSALLPAVNSNPRNNPPQAHLGGIPVVGQGPHQPISLVGTWERQTGPLRTYGANGNFGSTFNLGSAKTQYQFRADGSYTFTLKGWGGYSHNVHTFITETGHWQLLGAQLTLRGVHSEGEDRDKRPNGPVLRRFTGQAGTNSYGVTWFFSPISDTWALVLTTPKETDRDGSYSAIAAFANSYVYSARAP
jgi:hypothetical protein